MDHSFIFRAHRRASVRGYTSNLSLPSQFFEMLWLGFRGLHWDDVLPRLTQLRSSYPAPDVHAGGNEVGKVHTLLFMAEMKRVFLLLQLAFSKAILIFSEIVPGLLWSCPQTLFMNRIRKRLYRALMVFMRAVGGFSFRHVHLQSFFTGALEIQWRSSFRDRLDILNSDFQDMVEKAASLRWGVMPP